VRKSRFTESHIVGVLGLGMTYRQDVENSAIEWPEFGFSAKRIRSNLFVKISSSTRYAVGPMAGALLVACSSGASRFAPSTAMPQSAVGLGTNVPQLGRIPGLPHWIVAATAAHADRGRSWMAPDAKTNDLLYVSSNINGDVYVYSYPHGSLKGTLTGFSSPAGECVDKSGHIFITSGSGILEYAHGGTTPIATLKDAGSAQGCSVDPKTGDLAVTNYSTPSSAQGNVAIYKNAKGSPTYLTDSKIYYEGFCGYDNAGNLFVDGRPRNSGELKLSEIPSGRTSFKSINLNQTITGAGGVQWDGKHLALGNDTEGSGTIYQFAINGEKGTKVGSTALNGSSGVVQFWIEQARVIGPEYLANDVGIWAYPAGGSAKKTITGGFDGPMGATVSEVKI
jgi:hypothetical protein